MYAVQDQVLSDAPSLWCSSCAVCAGAGYAKATYSTGSDISDSKMTSENHIRSFSRGDRASVYYAVRLINSFIFLSN